MKKRILKSLIIIIFIIGVFLPGIVKAAETCTVSINGNSTVSVNSTITLTINISNITGSRGVGSFEGRFNYDATYFTLTNFESVGQFTISKSENTTGIIRLSGFSPDESFITGSQDLVKITLRAKKNGQTTVSVSNGEAGDSNGRLVSFSQPSKTINVNENNSGPTLSSDATLKGLTVSGYSIAPTFNANTTNYTINVPTNVTSVDVRAIVNDPKAKVSIVGNNALNKDTNNITVKVTAEDGSTKTYVITVKKPVSNSGSNNKSSNNNLKDLTIDNIDLDFDKNVTTYNITVPNEITKLDLKALAEDSKAKVRVIGNNDFKTGGTNIVEIEVTAEDGSVKIYTVNVTRSVNSSNTTLDDLIVEDYDLDPTFDPEKEEYEVVVPGNVSELDIKAIPLNDKATVEIIGNKNLKEGENTVLIKVTDENGFSRIYELNVIKKAGTFLGIPLVWWLGIGGFLLLLLLLLLIWLLKRKKLEEEPALQAVAPAAPPVTPQIIEIKPEFNFGSKNSDDDNITTYGEPRRRRDPKIIDVEEPRVIEAKEAIIEEESKDLYDDVVTKDEIVDTLEEAIETKDPSKLKMLLLIDKTNKAKAKVKKAEVIKKLRTK